MATYQNSDILKSLSLGKSTEYQQQYSADLLQAVPRSLNRDSLKLGKQLPFFGEDVWYGYEVSWLNAKGKPQVALAEFRIPCDSKNLIESKSFKLYLNGFNQTKFNDTQTVIQTMQQDLSACAEAEVRVNFYAVDHCEPLNITHHENYQCIDDLDITIDCYQYNASLLTQTNNLVQQKLVSHLLKSNCLITNQPDWASIYIEYKGYEIDHASLLKYLISFRQHNEFHEQCVERIFTDLYQLKNIESLTVHARYTRRGGLDINPFRSTENIPAPFMRTLRQ